MEVEDLGSDLFKSIYFLCVLGFIDSLLDFGLDNIFN